MEKAIGSHDILQVTLEVHALRNSVSHAVTCSNHSRKEVVRLFDEEMRVRRILVEALSLPEFVN